MRQAGVVPPGVERMDCLGVADVLILGSGVWGATADAVALVVVEALGPGVAGAFVCATPWTGGGVSFRCFDGVLRGSMSMPVSVSVIASSGRSFWLCEVVEKRIRLLICCGDKNMLPRSDF